MADYPEFSDSITELSQLLVNEEAFEDTLQRVAELARRNIGGCDVAGVTLVREGTAETSVFTDTLSPEVDSAQYETGVGPCLDAYRHQKVFRIASTAADKRWGTFSQTAAAHGIGSTISFPLAARGKSFGALNLYSKSKEAFSHADEENGMQFAHQASVAIANAQLYDRAYRLSQQLNEALTSRAVIDQAKGILMAQAGVSADEAFALLTQTSQRENRKVREIARELVDRARRR
jgi:GAF domain-containing protein